MKPDTQENSRSRSRNNIKPIRHPAHLPQSPFSVLCDRSWEGKHPFAVSEMGFHSAAMAVRSSGPLFRPSLSFFSSPPCCCHIWNPAPHLFMCSVLFLSFFLLNFKVLYLLLLAVSLHLMRSAITSHHNWSLYNYVLHHRIPPPIPPPPMNSILLIWRTKIE